MQYTEFFFILFLVMSIIMIFLTFFNNSLADILESYFEHFRWIIIWYQSISMCFTRIILFSFVHLLRIFSEGIHDLKEYFGIFI